MPLNGNNSGLGNQGYGANPTPSEQLYASLNQNSSQQLMQWAAWTDPTVQAATQLMGNVITGGAWNKESQYYEHRNTEANKFNDSMAGQGIQTALAMASMNGMLPGGSVGQMASGIQQMMGGSGFSMGGGTFNGAGFVTDMTSKYMMDSIRDQFFDTTTGFSNSSASGLGKGDFGDLAFGLGSRGAFRGMDQGSMVRLRSDNDVQGHLDKIKDQFPQMHAELQTQIKSMKDSGQAIDLNVLDPNSDTFSRITDAFKSSAKLISEFRDVFGNNAPVSQMLSEAEKLTGMDITETGASNAAVNKLSALKTMSNNNGLDMQGMIHMDQQLQVATAAQMAQMYGGSPSDYARMAAASTVGTWNTGNDSFHANAINRRMAGEELGVHIPSFTRDKIMSLNTTGVNRIVGEESIALEAMFMADTMSLNGKDDKTDIHRLVKDLGVATNDSERAKIRTELAGVMTKNGLSPGKLLQHYGNDPSALVGGMSQSSVDTFYGMAHNQEQSRIMDGSFRGMLSATNAGRRTGINMSSDGDSFKTLQGVFSAVGNSKMIGETGNLGLADILSKVHSGELDWDAVTKFATDNMDAFGRAGFESADDVTSKLKTMDAQARSAKGDSYKGLGDAFAGIFVQKEINPQFANETDFVGKIEREKKEVNDILLSGVLGTRRQGSKGVIRDIISGVLGDGNIDNSAILDYMSDTNNGAMSSYDIKDGKLQLDKKKAESLANQFGGDKLLKAFGASNMEDLASKLGTEAGTSKLLRMFGEGDAGAIMDTNSLDGTTANIRVGSAKGAEDAEEALHRANESNKALALSGLSEKKKAREVNRMKGLTDEEFSKEVRDRKTKGTMRFLGEGNVREFDDMISRANSGDDSDLKALTDDPVTKQKTIEMLEQRARDLNEDMNVNPFTAMDIGKYGLKGALVPANTRKKMAAEQLKETKEELYKLQGGNNEFLGRIEIVMGDTMSGSLFKKS